MPSARMRIPTADFSFTAGSIAGCPLQSQTAPFTLLDTAAGWVQVRTSKKADCRSPRPANHGCSAPTCLTDCDINLTAQRPSCSSLRQTAPFAVHLDAASLTCGRAPLTPISYPEVQAWETRLCWTPCCDCFPRQFALHRQGSFPYGQHLKLRGVACHQDFGGVGNAAYPADMDTTWPSSQELGANSVRL